MFVLCKNVNIVTYESHFYSDNPPQKASLATQRTPSKIKKGLTMSTKLNSQDQSRVTQMGVALRRITEYDLQTGPRAVSSGRTRRIHSIKCQNKGNLQNRSKDSKEATPLNRNKRLQTEVLRQRQQNRFKLHREIDIISSNKLAVTWKVSTVTSKSKENLQSDPQIESLAIFHRNPNETSSQGFRFDQQFSQIGNSRKFLESRSEGHQQLLDYSENSQSNNYSSIMAVGNKQEWQILKLRMNYELKRVQSGQDIVNPSFGEHNNNSSYLDAGYVVEQESLIKSIKMTNNFHPITPRISMESGLFTQCLALQKSVGILVSLKIYQSGSSVSEEQRGSIVNSQLRNYQMAGQHPNILTFYQHSIEKERHVLVKQPYVNALLQQNNSRNPRVFNPSQNKKQTIGKILNDVREALKWLEKKRIPMRQIQLEDIRECFNGSFKLGNLQCSPDKVIVSCYETNIKKLESRLTEHF